MLIYLAALGVCACATNVYQIPDPPVERNPAPRCPLTLYMGRMEVDGAVGGHRFGQNLKRSLAIYLAAYRGFSVVAELPAKADGLPKRYLVMDTQLAVKYDESYNWWVTWPAIYPLVAYWPLQIRTGKVDVKGRVVIVNEKGEAQEEFENAASDQQTVTFYGFFRTAALESTVRSTIAGVFRDIARSLDERVDSLCPAEEEENTTLRTRRPAGR